MNLNTQQLEKWQDLKKQKHNSDTGCYDLPALYCCMQKKEERALCTLDTLTHCIFTALNAISSPPIFSFCISTVSDAVWKQNGTRQTETMPNHRPPRQLYVTSPLGCHAAMGKLQSDIPIQNLKCHITIHIKKWTKSIAFCYFVIKQKQRDVTYPRLTQLCDL